MSAPIGVERCMGWDGFSRIRYSSPAKANRARIKMRTALRVYECHRCKGWHITSKPLRDSA